jgi:hypothetical protein
MTKRIAAIVLILTLGSVALGMPMHSSGEESGMMDCCKKALEQSGSPAVAAARLCCAMKCNQPASNTGNVSGSFSQTSTGPSSEPFLPLPSANSYGTIRADYILITSTTSKPTYILNLALLI